MTLLISGGPDCVNRICVGVNKVTELDIYRNCLMVLLL